MNIVIFEDIVAHQTFIADTIRHYIAKKGLNASIELITDSLPEIERYIANTTAYTLYFIDIVDRRGDSSGLELSEKIKQKNSADVIIFITGYLREVIYSTPHKILALNIITKNSRTAKKEICDTVEYAYGNKIADACLVIDNPNGETFRVEFNDVYMIETVKGCHKIQIHYKGGVYECAGLLKEIQPKLNERFKRCHKSYIVNLDKIERVSKKCREIVLRNGLVVDYAPHYRIDREF